MAFVRHSTVFGKRREKRCGYCPLLFYFPVILSIELTGLPSSWHVIIKLPYGPCLLFDVISYFTFILFNKFLVFIYF